MTEIIVRSRNEIPEQYRWNAASVYASREAWRADCEAITASLKDAGAFRGRVGGGADVAVAALAAREDLLRRVSKVLMYASVSRAVDTTDQTATQMEGQAYALYGQALAAVSYLEPELLAVGEATLHEWLAASPALTVYRHYIENLLRKQATIRSAEVEELLGMLADPFQGPGATADALRGADLKFPPAHTVNGGEAPVTEGTLDQILAETDREARRTAWEGYMDTFLAHKNTLASNLTTSIKQNVFAMRARRQPSSLEASLFEQNIPVSVFDNLIAVFRENLPVWHRYWAVRRRMLGVNELRPYDVWAPLTAEKPVFSYEQAVDAVLAGLAPLGKDYVDVVRRGCLQDRWVDVYPNIGKVSGAFSTGAPDTFPFIVMNFDSTLYSVSTLAHELGHSMHTYLTAQTQPLIYQDYSLFVAEVASNFHQAMVRGNLLANSTNENFQISVIEEAMDNFHRYFFIMPTLARFELECHRRVERGEGLSADIMVDLMADLFAEGYGSEMTFDRARTGITWATFTHLYADYYVYQYATGISAANTLSRGILENKPGAVNNYLSFLKAGGSVYPLDALKIAGVDLTTPDPVRQTFRILADMVERLEQIAS
jgi:oligoendopeptidase F